MELDFFFVILGENLRKLCRNYFFRRLCAHLQIVLRLHQKPENKLEGTEHISYHRLL